MGCDRTLSEQRTQRILANDVQRADTRGRPLRSAVLVLAGLFVLQSWDYCQQSQAEDCILSSSSCLTAVGDAAWTPDCGLSFPR